MNPSAAGTVQRPSLALLSAEPLRAALEFARHHLVKASPSKNGDGHPVVIFPGLGAGGRSIATLRDHCRTFGYQAFDWGQGFNTGPRGDLDAWLEDLKAKVADLLLNHDEVNGSHIGMGWNRDVLDAVADRLGHRDADAGSEQRPLSTGRPSQAGELGIATSLTTPMKASP